MSCHAQIVKRKALLWKCAAFLLSFSDGAAVLLSYWVVLTSPCFLGVALPYQSSFIGVLLSNILLSGGVAFPVPFWVVSRFPPPLGWCWRFLLILGGVAFSSSIILGGAAVFLGGVDFLPPHDSTILFLVLHWYIAHMTWHVLIQLIDWKCIVSESMKCELDLIWSNELKLNEEKWIILNWIKLSYSKNRTRYWIIKLNALNQMKLGENYKNEEREENILKKNQKQLPKWPPSTYTDNIRPIVAALALRVMSAVINFFLRHVTNQ